MPSFEFDVPIQWVDRFAYYVGAIYSAAFFLSKVPGDLISWAGRSATCLGSTYLLIAVLAAIRVGDSKTKRP